MLMRGKAGGRSRSPDGILMRETECRNEKERGTMKKFVSLLLCLCVTVGLLTTAVSAAGTFADVKDSDYFAKPVAWAVEQGITNGTGNNKFSPNQTCTRAQILTFLWRAAGCPEPQAYRDFSPYADVELTDYFCKPAAWAAETGITDIEGAYFKPNTPCTRGSTVEYFWRYARSAKADAVPFSDVKAGSDLANAVSWAIRAGITNGTGGDKFSPDKTVTRGQIVTFLHRYFVTPLDNSELISTLCGGSSSGNSGNSGSAPSDMGELDPLPPENYKKQPDWYGKLTPAHTMSNARLIAELERIEAVIAERQAKDIYMSDGPYSRQLDLWSQASQRYDKVKRYDRGIRNDSLSDRVRQEYEALIAAHGDADPLRDYFD